MKRLTRKIVAMAAGLSMFFATGGGLVFPAVAVESVGETISATESLGAPTRTEPLIIDDRTDSVDHLADEGWKWDVTGESSGTLTLNGFHLRTSGHDALEFQDQASGKGVRKVEIVLIGVNIVEATGMYFGPTVRGGLAGQDSEYTIRQAEGQQGSLEFVNTSDQWNVIEEVPYVFSGASLTIESGTITSNMDFASLSNAFTMNGGTLTIWNDEHWGYAAITSGDGRLTINGGTLNIKSQTGLSAPTYTGDGDGGGIYINGGDITIEGNDIGAALYAMNECVIDTTGTLRTSNYYWDIYVYNSVNGSVEIKRAKELSLGGEIQIWPQDVPTTIAPADYTALNTLIEKAKGLDSSDYEDFTEVSTALAQAEKIVDENKNLLQQSAVNEAAASLNKAIEALIPRPTPTPTPTPKPEPEPELEESRVAVWRAFNPNATEGSSHLYTTSKAEYEYLISIGWHAESVSFYALADAGDDTDGVPVYRAYNPNDGSHHYMTDLNEYEYLVGVGWNGEGVAWHAPESDGEWVLRAYNPNSGEHLFTLSQAELDNAVAYGWNDEGRAFRAFAGAE